MRKKGLIGILIVSMLTSVFFTGCKDKQAEELKWVEECAAKLDKDIRSGEFSLEGEVYTFPMEVTELTAHGWHVSNNYSNKDEFLVEPGGLTEEFTMFHDDGAHIDVIVANPFNEKAEIEKCFITSLRLSLIDKAKVVLPGGLFSKCKPKDVITVYGEADSTDNEGELFRGYYNFTSDDQLDCTVCVKVFDNDYTVTPFTDVVYSVLDTEDNYKRELLRGGVNERCTHDMNSTFEASYYGVFDNYVPIYDTMENATDLNQSINDYYGSAIMYYSGINWDLLDKETISKYSNLAASILKKTKWEIVSMNVDETSLTGTVEIKIYPTNFLDIIGPDIEKADEDFLIKYENVDTSSFNDYQKSEAETYYANFLLNQITKRASEIELKDAVTKTYPIDYNQQLLSDEDWKNVDDVFMDVEGK